MRIELLICTVVLLSANSAFALKTPSRAEIDDIQNQIYAANRMDKQVGDAEKLVERAKLDKQSKAEISRLEAEVVRERNKQNAA